MGSGTLPDGPDSPYWQGQSQLLAAKCSTSLPANRLTSMLKGPTLLAFSLQWFIAQYLFCICRFSTCPKRWASPPIGSRPGLKAGARKPLWQVTYSDSGPAVYGLLSSCLVEACQEIKVTCGTLDITANFDALRM